MEAIDKAKVELQALRRTAHAAELVDWRQKKRSRPTNGSGDLAIFLAAAVCSSETDAFEVLCRYNHSKGHAAFTGGVRRLRELLAEQGYEALAERGRALAQTPQASGPLFFLAQLAAESKAASWLTEANERGVAPHVHQLLAEFRRSWPAAGRSGCSQGFLLRLRHKPVACKGWAKQFRRRWHVTFRRLPARPHLTPEEMNQKAIWDQKWVQKAVPFLGSFFDP